MHPSCHWCGTHFEREPGYWVGAMYVAYALGVPVLSAIAAVLWLVGFGSIYTSFAYALFLIPPFLPFLFRYSRVVWMHLDQLIEPRSR